MKLLAVGDLHLGRQPARLPEALRKSGAARDIGPSAAWRLIVEHAVAEGVDAVALAGDVVEREDDFFEAYRELQTGTERLRDAGIPVFGVAGNHDLRVLPRLAARISSFHLLGADGNWEAKSLDAAGERLTLWGRSFPADAAAGDPMENARFERRKGINLGLLHCDLDAGESPYAPVPRAALEAAGMDGWLLGHIHVPSPLTAPNPFGYLGSVTGLDPGEHGARGPWLVRIDGGRIVETTQWTLAPLRWERIDVDLTGLKETDEARERVLHAVLALDRRLTDARWVPRAVGIRVRFTGSSRFGADAANLFSEPDSSHLHTGAKETHYFIERTSNAAGPEIALAELAARDDPAGLLARRILLLDRPEDDPGRRALLDDARGILGKTLADPRWGQLRPERSVREIETCLRNAGMTALGRLLEQRKDVS